MCRLVITGAGGFLGTHLVKNVCREPLFDEVIAITLGAEEMKNRVQQCSRLRIFNADAIVNGEVELFQGDLVLNCAYPRAVRGKEVAQGLCYIESVFKAASNARVKGIISISSQSVYDPHRVRPAVETDVPVLTDVYSSGKYCMELLLRNICSNIPYTNVRLASLIGPGFDVRVPNKMVKHALENRVIYVKVNQQEFGFLDVEDAVRGLVRITKLDPKEWNPVYNLGPVKTITLNEMAETIRDILYTKYHIDVDIIRQNDDSSSMSALDSSLLLRQIGEFRSLSFEESINNIVSTLIRERQAGK